LHWGDTAVAAFAKKFLTKAVIKVDVRERATCPNIARFQCLILLVAFSVEFEVDCQVFQISQLVQTNIFLAFSGRFVIICICVFVSVLQLLPKVLSGLESTHFLR